MSPRAGGPAAALPAATANGSPRPGLRNGLTGGIGSGKSTVARMLVDCGAVLIDTDAISRALTRSGGAAIPALRAEFGDDAVAPDGGLDRPRMRERAFADATVKARLEAVLHPRILAECDRRAALAAPDAVLVFDVPLLVESTPPERWRSRVDRILVVDCSESTQAARVAQRPGWSADAALSVISQQASREARRAVADAVILNEGLTLVELEAETRALWQRWCRVEQSP
jgi:dephospho-CoA kinase